MDWFDHAAKSAFFFASTSALNDKARACNVTRGITSTSFYGVNILTRTANAADCSLLNDVAFLRSHLAVCSDIVHRDVNLILVDCWEIGGALAVVQELNDAI
jgi:hypothetical protein